SPNTHHRGHSANLYTAVNAFPLQIPRPHHRRHHPLRSECTLPWLASPPMLRQSQRLTAMVVAIAFHTTSCPLIPWETEPFMPRVRTVLSRTVRRMAFSFLYIGIGIRDAIKQNACEYCPYHSLTFLDVTVRYSESGASVRLAEEEGEEAARMPHRRTSIS